MSSLVEPRIAKPRSRTHALMTRTLVNFLLDTFLLLVLLLLVWASFVLQVVFPPATVSAGWTLWGWNYDQWNGFQFGLLCVFMGGILLHLILHWTWVCAVIAKQFLGKKPITKDDGSLTLYGVGMLVVVVNVLGAMLAAAYFAIQSPQF